MLPTQNVCISFAVASLNALVTTGAWNQLTFEGFLAA
jgi:hypothetical protein